MKSLRFLEKTEKDLFPIKKDIAEYSKENKSFRK